MSWISNVPVVYGGVPGWITALVVLLLGVTGLDEIRPGLARVWPWAAEKMPSALPLPIGIAAAAVVLLIFFVYREAARLSEMPNFEISSVGIDTNPFMGGVGLTGYRIEVTNLSISTDAQEANARVDIYGSQGNLLFQRNPGDGLRWADLPALSEGTTLEKRFATVVANTSRAMNVLQHHAGVGTFLIVAESYRNYDWAENPALRIPPGAYTLKFTFRAKDMDKNVTQWADLQIFEDKFPEFSLRAND